MIILTHLTSQPQQLVVFMYCIVSYSYIFCNQGNQNADNLHYAALRDHKANRSTRQKDNTMGECVYSSVGQQIWTPELEFHL